MPTVIIETPPQFPTPTAPVVRTGGPGRGGPILLFAELLLFFELLDRANDGFRFTVDFIDFLADPLEAKRRVAVGVLCQECCRIVRTEADKTIRKIGPNLDKVSPKTSDDAKRARLRKRTRNPAW
jgi:hypothetical protein